MVASALGSRGVVIGAVVRALAVASEVVYANGSVEPPKINVDVASNGGLRETLAVLAQWAPLLITPKTRFEEFREASNDATSAPLSS